MLNVWIPLSSIVTIKFTVSLQTHVLCIKAFSISSLSPKSLCSINLYLTIHVLLFLNLKQLFYSQSLKLSYNFKIYLKFNLIPYFFEAFEYIFSIGSFEGHFSKFRFYGCFMQTSVLWSAPHILVGHYFECATSSESALKICFPSFDFMGVLKMQKSAVHIFGGPLRWMCHLIGKCFWDCSEFPTLLI